MITPSCKGISLSQEALKPHVLPGGVPGTRPTGIEIKDCFGITQLKQSPGPALHLHYYNMSNAELLDQLGRINMGSFFKATH